MTQNEKQIALPIGRMPRVAGVPQVAEARKGQYSMQDGAKGADAPDLERQDGEWRLRSIGYNLVAAAVIAVIVIIGTLFDVLQTLKNPGRWSEIWRRRSPPQLPLHEWHMDVSDEDVS